MDYASEQQVQYNNDTFTHCNSTTSTISLAPTVTSSITAGTSAPIVTTTSPSTSSSTSPSQSNTASIVGGVIGGVAGLALLFGAGFVCWRKHSRHQPLPVTGRDAATTSAVTPYVLTSQGWHTVYSNHVRVAHVTVSFTSDNSDQPSSGFTQQTRSRLAFTDVTPRSGMGTSYPSQGDSDLALPDPLTEPARHEDLGPVSALHRTASGRLPPPYNPQWEPPPPRPRARPLPQPTVTDATTSPAIPQPQLK